MNRVKRGRTQRVRAAALSASVVILGNVAGLGVAAQPALADGRSSAGAATVSHRFDPGNAEPHAAKAVSAKSTSAKADSVKAVSAKAGQTKTAAGKPVSVAGTLRNGWDAHLTATFTETSIEDHNESPLVITVLRSNVHAGAVSGLAFTFTLPTGMTSGSDDIDNGCGGEAAWGSTSATITVAGATLGAGAPSCSITASVTAGKSGTYQIGSDSAQIDEGDIGNYVATDTLLVTTAPPALGGYFKPDGIAVDGQSTLSLQLYRTDTNQTVATSGIGYKLTLPAGIAVVALYTNDCGGSVSAVAGSRVIALSGGVLPVDDSHCYTTVKVTSPVGGEYKLQNANFTLLAHVRLNLSGCKMARKPCAPTLAVEKLGQTVTFEQPEPRPIGNSALAATATSGLAPTFASETPSVCTTSGPTLIVRKQGVCTIVAGQKGNDRYAVAEGVTRTVEILPPPPAPPTVSAQGGTSSIAVGWTAPEDTSKITGYIAMGRWGDITTSCTPDDGKLECVLGAVAGHPYIIWVVSTGPNGTSEKTVMLGTATATAPVVPTEPPATPLVLTTTDGDITTAEPGQEIVFVGKGFAPFSTVTITIYSEPIVLGTAITNSVGSFSQAITVPPSLAAGAHTAVAQGVSPSGQPRSMALDITVAPAALPVTGANVLTLLLVGLGAVLAGGVLFLVGRPRRSGPRVTRALLG